MAISKFSQLRNWFFIHFLVDYLFALPLFFAPIWTLGLFGFSTVEPLTARLVAAALFGIGGISLVAQKRERMVFRTLLDLKLIWSVAAMAGILITLMQGVAPRSAWIFFGLFAGFFAIWLYYRKTVF